MCGIAGFTLQQSGSLRNDRKIVEAMLDTIAYRGPDQRGVELSDKIAFGHNRLTIIEPQGGKQPRRHPDTKSSLIYNGEIYGYRKFDDSIASAGHTLRDHCDTETLFWLIQMHGVKAAAQMLDGMFAFAYHDAVSDTLYLARDAMGQKPLFYAEANGELIFASEIKALLQHPSLASPCADIDALSLYLMMEYVPGSPTGIRGIHELPPGHVLSWANGRLTIETYWRTAGVTRLAPTDIHNAETRFDGLLSQAVEDQMVADVPVGIFLSGGLDSSVIAAMARRHRSDVATFTIKFPQSSYDESAFAEEVAQSIGTRHTTIELDRRNCVDGMEDLVNMIDQPFADSSLLPTYLLCKATRQHVAVALGGDGADELLLGYPNFRALRFAKMLQHMPTSFGRALESLAGIAPKSSAYMNAAFLLQQLSYGVGKPANMQSVYWMSALAAREQNDLWISERAIDKRIFEQVSQQVAASGQASLFGSCQQHFLNCYLPYNILQKTDRASMYTSLEVRAPFLSSAVANYALSLPHSSLYEGRSGKKILRSIAQSYVPATTIARKKHGFALPVASLIRGDLRDIIETTLLEPTNPMYELLHWKKVQHYWALHISEKADNGKKLWALFMLAAFFKNTFHTSK
jgi:asparagine synthase (glutamine-hydrolysing)